MTGRTRLLLAFESGHTTQEVATIMEQLQAKFPDIDFTALCGVTQMLDIGPAPEMVADERP